MQWKSQSTIKGIQVEDNIDQLKCCYDQQQGTSYFAMKKGKEKQNESSVENQNEKENIACNAKLK